MNQAKKKLFSVTIVLLSLLLIGNQAAQEEATSEIRYRFASKAEWKDLMLNNQAYYDGFCQNDLEYRLQKKDGTMEELLLFAEEQALDFTEEEKTLVDSYLTELKDKLKAYGYVLPEIDEIVFVKTTAKEEGGAGGYTHGTQIYIGSKQLEEAISGDEETKEKILRYFDVFFWHELFHCLTRCNPEFRAKMYELIHFTVVEKDYQLPPSVMEYFISNPDVEHHNAYASFHINGKDLDCFCALVTTKHFEKEGDQFLDCMTTALIPVDGTDLYYTPEQADNFDEVFGKNTDYVIDPEECMADNFSFAMAYGLDGKDGEGYPTPEIIEGILSYLRAD